MTAGELMAEERSAPERHYVVLVQSTDSFKDCWGPFFTLFNRFWPECAGTIILNTESEDFRVDGLDVRVSKIGRRFGTRKPTWSETLIACLDMVQAPSVVLVLDDMFACAPVDDAAVRRAVRSVEVGEAGCITLTEHGQKRALGPPVNGWLSRIDPASRYLVSTSPSVWSVGLLRSLLRSQENAWQFEVFGSRRARRRGVPMLAIRPEATVGGREGAYPYFQSRFDSGIVKGRWQPEIQQFFGREGVNVDYARRGFYAAPSTFLSKCRTARLLLSRPLATFRGLFGW
jgi:hypothetical protein